MIYCQNFFQKCELLVNKVAFFFLFYSQKLSCTLCQLKAVGALRPTAEGRRGPEAGPLGRALRPSA